MKRKSTTLVLGIFLGLMQSFALYGQSKQLPAAIESTASPIRCFSTEMEEWNLQTGRITETRAQFEDWLAQAIARNEQEPQAEQSVYTLPIVFHVVYRTATENISTAQILSQLQILNEDFARLNADTINTPAGFRPAAANTGIQFCLATRDPQGNSTTGIVRYSYPSGTNFTTSYVDGTIKPATIWNPEQYFNFWIVPLSGSILGYAQFPVSSLPGLSGSASANTDGVVCLHTSIGRPPANPFSGTYNAGRTATHEVGHYLGLRHIWGDGGCSVDDYCGDTPASDAANYGCPTTHVSCSTVDMVQNYMDYTDDACMNIFTANQRTRMRTVMENSPRRSNLRTSPVCQPLNSPPIAGIPQGQIQACLNVPVTLTDQSTNGPTQWLWTIQPSTGFQFTSGTSAASQNPVVIFSQSGSYSVQLRVSNAFGSDSVSQSNAVVIGSGRSIPFLETFPGATLASGWSISNPDAATTWGFRTGVTPAGTSTPMVWIDLFDYNAAGQEDGLVSPVIDLVGISNPVVSFDVSYARYSTTLFDKLRVDISTDCGLTFTNGIYLKENLVLATAGTVTTPFTPSTAAQWRRDSISLSNYAGQKIRLRFSSINGYGNNLYLANIRVNGQASAPSVTGNLRYLNTALTPFTNASIRLMQGTAQIASASTGSTGDFSFSAPSGSYGLKINTQKPWGGGNATDALFINRHFTGSSPLSGLPLLASDVNASGTVNSSDALIIMRRFTTQIDSFAAGNWILSPSSVTLPQSGSLGLNILAMGDVNGSYVPDVNLRTAYQPLGYVPSEWRMEEYPPGISGLFVDQDELIGAVSLDLLMPEGCVVEEVLGIAAWDACTWKQVGRSFRLAAYRQSGIPLTRGEALLRIRTNSTLGKVAINKQHSEFSDILGNPLNHLSLFQRLDGATQSSLFEPLRIYPNPSSGIVQVDLPKGVALESVSLFDALGRKVLSFDANEINLNPSGAELELSTLAEGTYRIDLKGTSEHGAFMGHALLVKR